MPGLPLQPRRGQTVATVGRMLSELYLHGLSTGVFDLALCGLLSEGAPLSASSIQRLKARFELEYEAWKTQDQSTLEVVNWWADGLYVKTGIEDRTSALTPRPSAIDRSPRNPSEHHDPTRPSRPSRERRLERPGEIPGAFPDHCLDSCPDGLPLLQPQALPSPSTFFVATATTGNTTGLARNWRPCLSITHAARRILPSSTDLSHHAVIRPGRVEN